MKDSTPPGGRGSQPGRRRGPVGRLVRPV